eukprot:gene3870-4132_t
MNFLSNLLTSKLTGVNDSRFPNSLPPTSALISLNSKLFDTLQPVSEENFDLPGLSPTTYKSIYASSVDGVRGVKGSWLKHQFLALANTAFDKHYGFVLNPSHLFLLIEQQIALHVNQKSEALRAQFVVHEGKKDLSMEIPATPTREEWAGIIEDFQRQIAANTVPDTKDLMSVHDFESAGEAEKVAGDVVLMDMCQTFFQYKMHTLCGIPYFIMEGAESDWQLLRDKAEQAISRKTLPDFSSFWLSALLPTLDKLLQARRGEVDRIFWENFYKLGSHEGSGGYTYVNGWINVFFPVTNENKKNRFCLPFNQVLTKAEKHDDGLDIHDYTAGIASAPVLWTRLGERIPMRFCAGFVGGRIVHDNALRPEVGWWVGPIDEEADQKKRERERYF